MNKAELASRLADQVGISKKVGEDVVAALEEIITQTLLQGGEVTIAGFGTFSAKKRAGRIGVNPRDPKLQIQIPPVTVAKFKAGQALKKALKGKKETVPLTETTAAPS